MDAIYKTGTQSETDPFEFVMSDESEDRIGDVIQQDGWSLADFRRNPIALFGHNHELPIGQWANVRVEAKRLIGKLELAVAGTSEFIDTLRKLLEQRILKAVSVGFIPTKYEPIEGSKRGGFRYLTQKLIECSLVSVPANPNALSLAKSLSPSDRARLFADSDEQHPCRSISSRTAEPGMRRTPAKGTPMSLAERIRTAQDELLAVRDQLTPLAKKIEEEEDLTDDEQSEFARLNAEVVGLERNLENLRAAERVLAGRSAPVGERGAGGSASGAPAIVASRHLASAKEKPRDLLVRMAVCQFQSHVQRIPLDAVKAIRYPDRDDIDAVIRATTNPAMTTVPGWAAELVSDAIDDFLESLKPQSVYAQLSARGAKFTFGRNGVIKIPRRTGGGSMGPGDLRGAFVGEGAPIPVRRASFASVSLTPHKMGVISHWTREMAQHSTPAIEALIRDGITEDTAIAIDQALLDANPATAVRPAGLLAGVTPIPGDDTGGIASIEADLAAIMTPFVTANAASGLLYLINPINTNKLRMASTAVGVYPFKADVQAGNIGGIPFIESTIIPADALILMRFADFSTATGDTPEWDVSDTAVVHEDDGTYAADQTVTQPTATVKPIVDAAGAAAKPVRSFWQTATVGVRMLLDMDWAMRRDAMVQEVTGIAW